MIAWSLFVGTINSIVLESNKMTDVHIIDDSNSIEQLVSANHGWKAVYIINEKYFIEDVFAYAFIKIGPYHEMIPLTPADLHLCQTLREFTLKDGYIGLINPKNELVLNDPLAEFGEINIQAVKEAMQHNRVKLD